MGSPKIAFIVLTCKEDAAQNMPDDELRREIEQTIAENRTIAPKWAVEKVTVFQDP